MSKFTFLAQENDKGRTIKDILKKEFSFSRRLRTKLKKQPSLVKLNDKEAYGWFQVNPGDLISVDFPQENSQFEAENIPIEILYEDEDLLVINKEPGMVCHPTKGHSSKTLSNAIQYYIDEKEESYKIRFISRLDMDTSGAILVAKNSHAQDHLIRQMTEGRVVKRYLALIEGHMEEDQGTIDLPIGHPEPDQLKRRVFHGGAKSVTHYKTLQREQFTERDYSLLELVLETGRTHQIRVHLSHIGHPVLGDTLYGKPAPQYISRQALHASYLSFPHPVSGKRMEIYAPLPDDLKALIENHNL